MMKQALPAKVKLEITLRYLATGDSLASLQYLFRVPKCTISHFLPVVLNAIYMALKKSEWVSIAKGFHTHWNYPNCVGALDGKHVVIQCPPNTTSLYYNCIGTFSIVLLALVDRNYCFTAIDIGSYGSQSDGAIFNNSKLKTALEGNMLNLPSDFIIVGDDAFPLKCYLMTQYSRRPNMDYKEKIYNYRHCRARHIVENAFGILAARFRIFRKPICVAEETAVKIVKANCALHNWIRKTNSINDNITVDTENHDTGSIIPGNWHQYPPANGLQNMCKTASRHYGSVARERRNCFVDYFVGDGAVSWQDGMI
ncbi:hypothetical protein RN001_001122 [Aquatica leii]|uniref:DDE Tnp4 domain-containing protein n=1 Tax=Aquatica leii TaxID=1421715 RepID=A0AAN7SCK4_9COLE|nr:hypothetical protein RN001_001122 [Aquatica leii]